MYKRRVYISISTIDKAQQFVLLNQAFDGYVDLISERYVVDGKSILGLLSLNLMSDIEVSLQSEFDICDKQVQQYEELGVLTRKEDSDEGRDYQ